MRGFLFERTHTTVRNHAGNQKIGILQQPKTYWIQTYEDSQTGQQRFDPILLQEMMRTLGNFSFLSFTQWQRVPLGASTIAQIVVQKGNREAERPN